MFALACSHVPFAPCMPIRCAHEHLEAQRCRSVRRSVVCYEAHADVVAVTVLAWDRCRRAGSWGKPSAPSS
eukprot:1298039-Alexandrium_andersonii.AAC.1